MPILNSGNKALKISQHAENQYKISTKIKSNSEKSYCHPNFFRLIVSIFSGAVRLGQAIRDIGDREIESGMGMAGRFRLLFSRKAPVHGRRYRR